MEEVVQTLVKEGVLVGERGQYHLEHTPTTLHIPPTVQGVLPEYTFKHALTQEVAYRRV